MPQTTARGTSQTCLLTQKFSSNLFIGQLLVFLQSYHTICPLCHNLANNFFLAPNGTNADHTIFIINRL